MMSDNSSTRSFQQYLQHTHSLGPGHGGAASPEEIASPGARSLASLHSLNATAAGPSRLRAGSMQKVLLQVTTDNEQFTLVDISGMKTADGIKERVFSKVSQVDSDRPQKLTDSVAFP